MYSNFMFLDQFLFELSCKSTHAHTHAHIHRHTHRDSNEYPIVAFSKNATIIMVHYTCTINIIVSRKKHSCQVLEMTIREICRDVCIEGEGPRRNKRPVVWGPPRPPEALGLLVNKLYTLGLFEPMTA